MAASAARASFGATFALSSVATSAAVLTGINVVGEILTITAPTYTANTIDVTNQNTTDYFKEYVIGVRDAGSLSFTANYISSSSGNTDKIPNAFYNGSKVAWKITLSGAATMNIWYGYGYITSYTVTSPPDGAVTFATTIKVTGKPTGPVDST
jgi:predicted secreted protein